MRDRGACDVEHALEVDVYDFVPVLVTYFLGLQGRWVDSRTVEYVVDFAILRHYFFHKIIHGIGGGYIECGGQMFLF